jgi:hypothetical protein
MEPGKKLAAHFGLRFISPYTMYPGTGYFGSLRCQLRAFVKETDPAILERLTSNGNVGRNALAGWAIGACIWLSCRAVAVGFVLVSLERSRIYRPSGLEER